MDQVKCDRVADATTTRDGPSSCTATFESCHLVSTYQGGARKRIERTKLLATSEMKTPNLREKYRRLEMMDLVQVGNRLIQMKGGRGHQFQGTNATSKDFYKGKNARFVDTKVKVKGPVLPRGPHYNTKRKFQIRIAEGSEDYRLNRL
ncbi:hypothetical protein HAX54_044818, partial [Datura stramonium]|nr:hypothetical protein [Datura stramonium]